MEIQCCLSKYYNAYIFTETTIFASFLTQKKISISYLIVLITLRVILWFLRKSCLIFIDIACYNHSCVFNACFTISMHITKVILAVMLKSAIFKPKISMCPILPLNKNYLEPKNCLEIPEWQDNKNFAISSSMYNFIPVILIPIPIPN